MPVDRLLKASKIPVAHFQALDANYVEECFPNASPTLKQRLAEAITRRRQLLKYYEQHHAKLAGHIEQQEEVGEESDLLSQTQPMAAVISESADPLSNLTATVTARSIQASTKATTFVPPEDDQTMEVMSESETVSSFALSEGGRERVRIPPRPYNQEDEEQGPFRCPFCFHLVEVRSSKAWA